MSGGCLRCSFGVADDLAVTHFDDAITARGELGIMGDEDQCGAGFGEAGEEHFDDGSTCGGVEIAGGLVGEDERWASGEGAGDADALLFAAGKLGGIMSEAVGEADGGELGRGARGVTGDGCEFERDGDIFERGHGGDEVKGLQDDADAAAARPGKAVFIERRKVSVGDEHAATIGALEASEDGHERGLAGARWTEDGEAFPGGDLQADAA